MAKQKRSCTSVWFGRVEYEKAWHLQRALAVARSSDDVGDLLLLLEHPHVYTLGRRGRPEHVLLDEAEIEAVGAQVYPVDRGGEVTYHGPGQLVGYPIVNLRDWGGGPVTYVRTLEDILIRSLKDLGVTAQRVDGLTGVWVMKDKVASIGVRIGSGVTTHGFALNVDSDLSYYKHIVPCGLADGGVTSVCRALGQSVSMDDVRSRVVEHFGRQMGFSMMNGDPSVLWDIAAVGMPATTS